MKRLTAVIMAVILAFSLTACGEKTVSQKGENIVQSDAEGGRNFEVLLDERTEETQYSYGEDDLSLVDTDSGKKITLGMSITDIEEITGEPTLTDNRHRVYDGVVVRYDENDMAVSFIISGGQFKDGKETRYKTTRGIGIGSSAEDFKTAYGDSYTKGEETKDETGETVKTASTALRYFKKDGNKIEFLGTQLSDEQKNEDTENYYLQDFMFSNSTGNIATIRIGRLSAATGGI